ncbi:MAG: glycoside hydrolase/phage tail family protein [Hyphomicrobiaceae bacterium]
MATLALTVAGAAVGNALLPAGISVLGTSISGAVIGSQIGALAGTFVDQALFGASGPTRAASGPRLSDLRVTASTEGAAVPRLYGRARLGGQVIWARPLEERATTTGGGGGGKGIGGSQPSAASSTTYSYFASFAVGLCEGEITSLGRVWADGKELDLTRYTWRLYRGTETQSPDALVVAHEGIAHAPAYLGLAYVVFESMPLEVFGNRIPQLSFEVHRAVDDFEKSVRGTVLIPGSGEFVYSPVPVSRRVGAAQSEPENTHSKQGATDWGVALDQLTATLPNARSTSLVVSWFGSDLRAGACLVRPAVDSAIKETSPLQWSVAGLTRAGAPLVSLHDGRPAYGGTPSDQTVIAAIRDLKSRGHAVTLTPFILMDIPSGNGLVDPYSGASGQPSYPWRGRITVAPAPGQPGSPDKTAAATTQIAAFVGTAAPGHFAIAGDTVTYTGPPEWTLRRMILHYAKLAVAAGGVDAFLIGSELRGLTQVQSGPGSYPFVAALVALAADVKAILGPGTKVSYAADWSEYFGHHPTDGSGDVHFHLDPLWSSPSVDAVAIDCYWPLSDWRDGFDHLDRVAGARSIYDLDYLKSGLTGGEGYDWYYASEGDRDAQVRTPITDGTGKPWVFRYKDLKSWWLNPHFDRPGGVESGAPTAWVPQSKPFWLTELGCPSADKGANQPNVFVDPKSAESFLPYYSRGTRDDLVQRRYLQAFTEFFDPDHPDYLAGSNPVSTNYGGRMLDLGHVHLYAWDARPYPAFPANATAWGDGENWRLGHWLTGRIASQPLASVVDALLTDFAFDAFDVRALDGVVPGLQVERVMSAREAMAPLELAYFIDAVESGDLIHFRHRGTRPTAATVGRDDLVETKPEAALVSLTRGQETELPAAARIAYAALESDYRQAVAASHRLVGASGRSSVAELALTLDSESATRIAETWLFDTWAGRERASFTLPPSRMALEPSDTVALLHDGRALPLRIVSIGDQSSREIEARSLDPSIYVPGHAIVRAQPAPAVPASGQPLGIFLDLPVLSGNEDPDAGHVAAARIPWPGSVAFYRSPEASGFTLAAQAQRLATTGLTLDPLPPGPEGRIDHATRFRVRLDAGTLTSATALAVLSGANAAAVRSAPGLWEVLQFEQAVLVADRTYELSRLLRGQAGTEVAMASVVSAGARFVLLDAALTPVPLTSDQIGLMLNWRYGPGALDIAHADFASATHAFSGIGRRPYSPVHIRAQRSGGDLTVTWTRRTRQGGDNWSMTDLPLGEDAELYEVDILDGPDVVRTITTPTTAITYTTVEQTTDFGGPQPAVHIRVHQVSATWGRGSARDAIV